MKNKCIIKDIRKRGQTRYERPFNFRKIYKHKQLTFSQTYSSHTHM